jgi:hypothetical protein
MSVGSGVRQGLELGQRKWAAFFEDLNKRIEEGAEFETTIPDAGAPLRAVASSTAGPERVRLRRGHRDGARAKPPAPACRPRP